MPALLPCCSSQLGSDISEAEAKEAVRILDSGSTGYIQVRVVLFDRCSPVSQNQQALVHVVL